MLFSCVRNETGCGKFALRALSQCLAREFQPLGVHVAHVIIDGLVGPPRFSCISINQVYIILYSFSLIEESSIDACIPTNILLAITIHFIYIYIYNKFPLFVFAIDSRHQRLRERWLGNNRAEEGTGQWTQTRWLKPTGTCMFRTERLGPKRLISVLAILDFSSFLQYGNYGVSMNYWIFGLFLFATTTLLLFDSSSQLIAS